MTVITLKDAASGSAARISIDRGFNCFEFQAVVGGRRVDVLDSDPGYPAGAGRPSGNGIPILFPYPNRIKGGRYHWSGRDYVIPPEVAAYDRTGNAIHGFCLDRAWRIVEQTVDSVLGEFHLSRDAVDRRAFWPSDFTFRVRYTVSGTRLRADFEISNPDTVPLPWGLGTHPYFKLPLDENSRPEQCLVTAPVGEFWELSQCLPSGKKRSLPTDLTLNEGMYFGQRPFDDVFTVLPSDVVECSIIDERAGLQVSQRNPSHFTELVIYTPPNRAAICFEPYTCVTDAINLEAKGIPAGWQTLDPGRVFRSWIEIEAGLVIA